MILVPVRSRSAAVKRHRADQYDRSGVFYAHSELYAYSAIMTLIYPESGFLTVRSNAFASEGEERAEGCSCAAASFNDKITSSNEPYHERR